MHAPTSKLFFTILLFLIMICRVNLAAQDLPKKKEIVKTLQLANNYFMAKWPDPGKEIGTDKTHPSNTWTSAVYYEGLMALYNIDKQKKYYEYAVKWGESNNWSLMGGPETREANNQACGQTYIDLFYIERELERIEDIKASIDNMVNSDQVDDWSSIDALQMAMPVFARLGVLYNKSIYFEKMHALFNYTKTNVGENGLYNPEDHLWWYNDEYDPPYAEPNGKDCYWARGNGWVLVALAKVLDILPENEPHRSEYQYIFQEMAAALLPIQRNDGFWNVSLHDPTHFGGRELTGTALFITGMAWGVNHGLLDKGKYLPAITKAWHGMVTEALHPDGSLGFVQGLGEEPEEGQPVTNDTKPEFEDYGLGCFLLAGSEVYQLVK